MDSQHYHLIGIGGIGMSGIAQLLLSCGITVTGSDVKESIITQELSRSGAKIFIGHKGSNIDGAGVVVYSSAIGHDNPEILAAKKKGLPVVKRAEVLAELMQDKIVVTVSGSHGKTTTASLAAYLLISAGMQPTVAIGGILRNINTNACFGKSNFFVAEADESDGSFLQYKPKYSIITNIDKEHLDYYKSFENEISAFEDFFIQTKEEGCVFCCGDDPIIRNIAGSHKRRHVFFGLDEKSDIYCKNIEFNGLTSEFDCFYNERYLDRLSLSLGGEHNISNALSIIALGLELGIDLGHIKYALLNYKGARRRLEIKLDDGRYLVLDDYAHHPTEIKATLSALRRLKKKRMIAIFQPHRYTRTKILQDDFGLCFDSADYVIVTDIYAAGEKAIEGLSAEVIADKIHKHSPDKQVLYLKKEGIVENVLKILTPGDLLVTLGAGDITRINDELVEGIKRKN